MKEVIEIIHKYLLDSKKSVSRKLGNLVLVCMALLLFDLSFNVTNSRFQINKLNKLEKINLLVNKYSNDQDAMIVLRDMETSTLYSEHYSAKLKHLWNSIFDGPGSKNIEQASSEVQIGYKSSLSVFWTILSSSTVFLILALFSFTAPVWSGNLTFSNIRDSSLIGVVFCIGIFVNSFISINIPVLFESYVWLNYLLYFTIQVAFISWFFYVAYLNRKYKEKFQT